MSFELRELSCDEYAERVLPLTHSLWAGTRDVVHYIDDNLALANTTWGKKHFRTWGLFNGDELVASHKTYAREVLHEDRHLSAIGIGAVFTPPEFRGRGYASSMLARSLDECKRRGDDAMFLFSDIAPVFYESIGFVALASRAITIRADNVVPARIPVRSIENSDATAIRACFTAADVSRSSRFLRSPAWWQWAQTRLDQGSEHPRGAVVGLMIGTSEKVDGYVIGVRMPSRDAFILDECGLADPSASEILATLLRSAAGDLHRITGWLPPNPLRSLLPRGSVHRRRSATLMIAPVSRAGKTWVKELELRDSGDPVWALDHV